MATAYVLLPVHPKIRIQQVIYAELERMVRENPVAPLRVGATNDPNRRAGEYSSIYSEAATMYFAPTSNMNRAENVLLATGRARGGCRGNIQQNSNMAESPGYVYAIFVPRVQVTVPELARMMREGPVAPVWFGATDDLHRTAREHQQVFGANVTIYYAESNNMLNDDIQLLVTYLSRGGYLDNSQQHANVPASPGYVCVIFPFS